MIKFNKKTNIEPVTKEEMQAVYEKLKTPNKYGCVIRHEHGMTDCPTIFRKENRWYMMYTAIDQTEEEMGYDTWLAVSDDLMHWEKLGKVLTRTHEGWDGAQRDGGLALLDLDWNGNHELGRFDGKHWLTYIGGETSGYETPPLQIGLACTEDASKAEEWKTFEKPILRMDDEDARWFESYTLYKSYIFEDPDKTLGYPFVMYYNCKGEASMPERIGMAVSEDMVNWERYGDEPVIDNADIPGNFISGDPQIVKMNDLWVMNYFAAEKRGDRYMAYDTFAVSKDLISWTKWDGKALIEPEEEWEDLFAHKPFVLKHEGKVYHFYCACNTKGERFIALATS